MACQGVHKFMISLKVITLPHLLKFVYFWFFNILSIKIKQPNLQLTTIIMSNMKLL